MWLSFAFNIGFISEGIFKQYHQTYISPNVLKFVLRDMLYLCDGFAANVQIRDFQMANISQDEAKIEYIRLVEKYTGKKVL